MSKKNVAIGFISGATIGAAAALLLAPQKGKYLRADIKRRASQAADNLQQYVAGAASRVSDSVRRVVQKTDKVTEG